MILSDLQTPSHKGDFTLFELNRHIHQMVDEHLNGRYWVTGELLDGKVGYGGHFYGELVEKDTAGEGFVARARVHCWARTYSTLSARFRMSTGHDPGPGMKIRILVCVTFHEQYGFSLHIQDIDPNFTLGDMVRRRREILAQLEADGIIHDNQELPLPRLLQRVAVVSSAGAAGWGDFKHHLLHNEYGLKFSLRLFPAVMQGQHVEGSVISALETIAAESDRWDIVVIIRGGGATGDLSDFDSYLLASCIAQFPLPVVVGIGHERDETVLDHVAHTRVKTPTAAAAFLVSHQADEAMHLDELSHRIAQHASQRLSTERQHLHLLAHLIPLKSSGLLQKEHAALLMLRQRITSSSAQCVATQRHSFELLEQRLQSADYRQILARGYSLTLHKGHVLPHDATLHPGDEITTLTHHAVITSTVKSWNKNKQ